MPKTEIASEIASVARGLLAVARPGLRGLGRRLIALWRSLPGLGRRLLELAGLGLLTVLGWGLQALLNWAWNRYLNWKWLNIALGVGFLLYLLGLFVGFIAECIGAWWESRRERRAAREAAQQEDKDTPVSK